MTDYSRIDEFPPPPKFEEDRTDLIGVILGYLAFYFRPVIKGFLRITTRLCELQRICYGEAKGGPRSIGVETSLRLSRNRDLRSAVSKLDSEFESGGLDRAESARWAVDELIVAVMKVKKIKKNLHQQFIVSLRFCLGQIWGYKQLVRDVKDRMAVAFDSDNLEHERMLLQLWSLLQPGVPLLKRKSKEWQNIGFQGEDPKTDFRGMGMLGLDNLLYFAKEYNTAAKYILSHSHHPTHGYSFAIVGINITHMAYKFLSEGHAKSHFYNVASSSNSSSSSEGGSGKPTMENFNHFYCFLFVEFDKFWMEMKPSSMMSFSYIRDLFENRIRTDLARKDTCFRVRVAVDTV